MRFDLFVYKSDQVVLKQSFHVDCVFAKIHRCEFRKMLLRFEEGSDVFEKGVYFPEEGVYLLSFPLWR